MDAETRRRNFHTRYSLTNAGRLRALLELRIETAHGEALAEDRAHDRDERQQTLGDEIRDADSEVQGQELRPSLFTRAAVYGRLGVELPRTDRAGQPIHHLW